MYAYIASSHPEAKPWGQRDISILDQTFYTLPYYIRSDDILRRRQRKIVFLETTFSSRPSLPLEVTGTLCSLYFNEHWHCRPFSTRLKTFINIKKHIITQVASFVSNVSLQNIIMVIWYNSVKHHPKACNNLPKSLFNNHWVFMYDEGERGEQRFFGQSYMQQSFCVGRNYLELEHKLDYMAP